MLFLIANVGCGLERAVSYTLFNGHTLNVHVIFNISVLQIVSSLACLNIFASHLYFLVICHLYKCSLLPTTVWTVFYMFDAESVFSSRCLPSYPFPSKQWHGPLTHTCSHMHQNFWLRCWKWQMLSFLILEILCLNIISALDFSFESELDYLSPLAAVNMSYLPVSRRWNASCPPFPSLCSSYLKLPRLYF